MKIEAIRGYHLGYTLSAPLGNANGFFSRRESLVIELLADNGVRGWGETVFGCASAAAHIRNVLAGLLVGQDPADINRHYRAMLGTCGYDRRGVAMFALSALDLATHDLLARAEGVSIARMLGGKLRDRVFAYASGPYLAPGPDPYAHFPAECDRMLKLNFRAIKTRIGAGVARDARAMTALRAQVGPDVDLMVDINSGYTPATALEGMRRMAPLKLAFVEEPVDVENLPGLAMVANSGLAPIATGESLANLNAFRDLLMAVPAAVLQPDMGVCGGFTGYRQIATLAEAMGTPTMPHVWGSGIGFWGCLQMTAILPSFRSFEQRFPFIECDFGENQLQDICGAFHVESDGTIVVPDAPGIGVTVEPDRFRPFLLDHWEVR